MFFGQAGFGEVQRRALDEGRKWETGVRNDLAKTVFDDIYPGLIRALIEADPERPLAPSADYLLAAREAALTLLYRLLFVLYAEDRDLLPQRERQYEPYAKTMKPAECAFFLDAPPKIDDPRLFRIV